MRKFPEMPATYRGTRMFREMPRGFTLIEWNSWHKRALIRHDACGAEFYALPYNFIARPVCRVCLDRFDSQSDVWRLRQMRAALGLSNRELSDMVNYTSGYVEKVLMGEVQPPVKMMELLEHWEKENNEDVTRNE